MRSGEMSGFESGKAQVFRTAAAVKEGSGEHLRKREVRRLEEEGFVEAALVRVHDRAEPSAKVDSGVLELGTAADAEAEMRAEFKEEFDLTSLFDQESSHQTVGT
jgi:hypothetical protein